MSAAHDLLVKDIDSAEQNPEDQEEIELTEAEKQVLISLSVSVVYQSDGMVTVFAKLIGRVHSSWYEVFIDCTDELEIIANLLDSKGGDFLPLKDNLFKAFELTSLDDTVGVILGQDPYPKITEHGPQAIGLSFSVTRRHPVAVSLKNIYKKIKSEYPEFMIPAHGDLTGWAKQGILMLNACLTVNPNEPDSHAKRGVWKPFIKKVFDAIAKKRPDAPYMLWGNRAQEFQTYIGQKSTFIRAPHPAARGDGFNKHEPAIFRQFSEKVCAHKDHDPINWQL